MWLASKIVPTRTVNRVKAIAALLETMTLNTFRGLDSGLCADAFQDIGVIDATAVWANRAFRPQHRFACPNAAALSCMRVVGHVGLPL